jgi:hypothetical protein
MASPGSWWNSVGTRFLGVPGSWRASCCVMALNARTGVGAWATCVQMPSSKTVLAEGALSPRARRTLPEGWGWALERGGTRPGERLTLERGGPYSRGVPVCRPGGPRGPPGSWSCHACVLGAWVDPRFAFFAGFKRVSPGYLGDPCDCPRQEFVLKSWK